MVNTVYFLWILFYGVLLTSIIAIGLWCLIYSLLVLQIFIASDVLVLLFVAYNEAFRFNLCFTTGWLLFAYLVFNLVTLFMFILFRAIEWVTRFLTQTAN